MKLAIVTGGSKGLGEAFVKLLQNNEYTVIEFSRTGSTKSNIKCDFSHPESSADIVENTLRELSNDDYSEILLVNNVGTIEPIGPISNFPASKYIKSIHVNFLSSITVTGLFTKYFQEKKCKKIIINISSGAASKPKYGWAIYCGIKAGLEHFVKTFAMEQETEKYPIQSVIANPGIVDTGMQEAIRSTNENYFPEKERFTKFKENNKLCSPDLVAEILFKRSIDVTDIITRVSAIAEKNTMLFNACLHFIENIPDHLNYITPAELRAVLKESPQSVFILDIRNSESFKESHIKGAINILLDDLFQSKAMERIPVDKPVVVCCGIGHVASQIVTLLQLLGYDAIGLKYGMGVSTVASEIQKGWVELGYPVESYDQI